MLLDDTVGEVVAALLRDSIASEAQRRAVLPLAGALVNSSRGDPQGRAANLRLSDEVVFAVVDGAARCLPVRLGPSSLAETIISEGLDPSSTVVVGPYKALEKLDDGDPLKVDAPSPAPESDESGDAETAVADAA